MKKILHSLLILLALAPALLATTPAVDHPGALPILLGLDTVRADLKLDSLQKAVLESIRDEYKTSVRKLTDPMPSAEAQRVAAEKQLAQINERFNQRCLSVLNDKQKARLVEVEHQMLGATMLIAPSVQKRLGLSDAQKKSIEALRQKGLAYVASVNHQFEAGQIGYQDRLELLRSKRVSQGTAFLKILTPEQRSVFLSLGGKKIAG